MGIGMGYAIAAAVETGKPVVAIEGDSAFGFSGMEIETICRYRLPVTVVILNNGGVYRGDEAPTGNDPAPTVLNARCASRVARRGVRRQGISRHHTGRAAVGADRGARVERPVDHRLRTRPGGRGGKRTSGESQPDQRGRTATGCGQRRCVIPSSCALKNSSSASCCADAVSARATGDPGPAELVASAISAFSTGSTISTARISAAQRRRPQPGVRNDARPVAGGDLRE